ncbi:MAG: hypothetical protein M3N82_01155 [Pseudomonadota bacterium]|nr:hypothetical protein [Pseudomonadota bacterium]
MRSFTDVSLTTERLNIVAPDGTLRLVIANEQRFPPPIINGKPLKRAVNPAGLLFFNDRGDEVGGLALSEPGGGRLSALSFDYPNFDAVGLLARVASDGKDATAGLVINSRAPAEMSAASAARFVQQRVAVQNHNEFAEVVLSDPAGRAWRCRTTPARSRIARREPRGKENARPVPGARGRPLSLIG